MQVNLEQGSHIRHTPHQTEFVQSRDVKVQDEAPVRRCRMKSMAHTYITLKPITEICSYVNAILYTRACIAAESSIERWCRTPPQHLHHAHRYVYTQKHIMHRSKLSEKCWFASEKVSNPHANLFFLHLTPICACSPSCAVSRLQLLLIFWNLKSKWMCSTEDVPLDFLERYLEII